MYELIRLGQIPINQACHHLLVHGQHHAGVYERKIVMGYGMHAYIAPGSDPDSHRTADDV